MLYKEETELLVLQIEIIYLLIIINTSWNACIWQET
jgi:hypothetical protein